MRQLRPDEKARTGDWFYVHDHHSDKRCSWIQLSEGSMPLKTKTIRQNDRENKVPHYPIIILRPTAKELAAGTKPKKPHTYNAKEWAQIKKVRDFYSEQL